ncbi:hypothetical protein K469DRAFT_754652 [Zopfia rhizophila CBS 207.26]|uniref:Major facilitator superfamily (MFS) profile domain-containing protein n=1 Tax=Zopfia rhizophila CBS 207.26 TaxID=1314779 RepID=A0A6A6DL94_9PEZI|nr:hypothetical protein K469DRAFT_754652 [Zopfia rhizophila CBS 207.26]
MAQNSSAVELAVLQGDTKSVVATTAVHSIDREDSLSEDSTTAEVPSFLLLGTSVIFALLTGVITTSNVTTGLPAIGLPAIGLPKIAEGLHISNHLLLWPVSIYGLTIGCSLLIAGSIADVVGSRMVYLFGYLLISFFVLARALTQTSVQLIVSRGFQGIAASCCLPTVISILSGTSQKGDAVTLASHY